MNGETTLLRGETVEGETETPRHVVSTTSHAGALTEYREPSVPANPFDVDPALFQRQIAQRGENYQALVGWLVDHMVDGEDVIQIHTVKKSNCEAGGPPSHGQCSPTVYPWHWSDPDLSKKGAEKVCGLLGIGARFLGMNDFKRAAIRGLTIEHVIIECELYSSGGAPVSQGTGACSLSEVKDSLNSCLKKACKRAHVDAVKRCAGLSGLATEIKKRMGPIDPEQAQRAARAEASTVRMRHENARFATGQLPDRCPLKKHKNKPWREVPADYLEWVVEELTGKPDITEAAAAELARRKQAAAERRRQAAKPEDLPPMPEKFDSDIPY